MKTLIAIVLGSWAYLLASGCAIAQELMMPAIPITVEAHVRNSDGNPVEGATVNLSLPRYRLGDRNEKTSALTNEQGLAIVKGIAQQDYILGAGKNGYYYTVGPHRDINDEKSREQYSAGVQKIDLELRAVRNPIKGIRKGVDRVNLPAFDTPLGFDLEVGDWIAPYGKGKTSDFVFTVRGYFRTLNDYDQSLTLTFSNPGDGITLFKHPEQFGSALKWPYEAPLNGYESQRVWRKTFDGKTRTTNLDNSGETNYIFRVRTELDEHGNLRRAMHGVISSEVVIGGNNEIGRNLSFTYAVNPDWTRNIEFDPVKTASSPR